MRKGLFKLIAVGFVAGFVSACTTTSQPPAPTGPDYSAVFETKRGVLLTARQTQQAVYANGAVQQVSATQYLIREAGSGEIIELTEQGTSNLEEGDPVLIVYGPETRVVYDH